MDRPPPCGRWIEGFGALAELETPELGDDVVEPFVQCRQPGDLGLESLSLDLEPCCLRVDPDPLRPLGQDERAERVEVVRQGVQRRLHANE